MWKRLSLTAALMAAFAVPAAADGWNQVGAVTFEEELLSTKHMNWLRQSGKKLSFMTRRGDVWCERIDLTFMDGDSRTVFSGRLNSGQVRTVRIARDEGKPRRITASCMSKSGHNVRLIVKSWTS